MNSSIFLNWYCQFVVFDVIRFHDLRHSCISLLVNNNHNMKLVQEYAGHADFSVTVNLSKGHTFHSSHNSIKADLFQVGLSIPKTYNCGFLFINQVPRNSVLIICLNQRKCIAKSGRSETFVGYTAFIHLALYFKQTYLYRELSVIVIAVCTHL